MAYTSVNAATRRVRRPQPTTTSARATLGGSDVRRTSAQTAATSSRSEGIPGSDRLQGQMARFASTRAAKKAARKQIRSIFAQTPNYLTDSDPSIRLFKPLAASSRDLAQAGLTLEGVALRNGDRNIIKLSPEESINLAGGYGDESVSPEARAHGAQVLVHELVHTNQPRLPHWLAEGGAELLSRKVSRANLGNTFLFDTDHPYQPFVRKVKRRGGADLVRRFLEP